MKLLLNATIKKFKGLAPLVFMLYGILLCSLSIQACNWTNSKLPLLFAPFILIMAIIDLKTLKVNVITKKILSKYYNVDINNIDYNISKHNGALIHKAKKNVHIPEATVSKIFDKKIFSYKF